MPFPLPQIWAGVSVEDQRRADERIPELLATPAAVRWISYEPALGPVDFEQWLHCRSCGYTALDRRTHLDHNRCPLPTPTLDQIIVGGESGPGARPFNIEWARSVIAQCRAAGVACFVKQLGAQPEHDPLGRGDGRTCRLHFRDSKGGNAAEWPEDLRVREYPERGDA